MPGIINSEINLCYYSKFILAIIILIYAHVFEMMVAAVKLVHFFIKNTQIKEFKEGSRTRFVCGLTPVSN